MGFITKIHLWIFVTVCLLLRGGLSKSAFSVVKENENPWTSDNSMEQAIENTLRDADVPWSWNYRYNSRFGRPTLMFPNERQDEDRKELMPFQMKKNRNLFYGKSQQISPFKFEFGDFKKRRPTKTIQYSQCYFNPVSCF